MILLILKGVHACRMSDVMFSVEKTLRGSERMEDTDPVKSVRYILEI